jgi:ABC-2 type transport system permease protein
MLLLLRHLYHRYRSRRASLAPASPGGRQAIARLLAHQARYDLLAFLRNKQARFATLLFPLLFLFIFVSAFGDNTVGPQHAKPASYYVPGVATMTVITTSFFYLVVSTTAQRESGVLKRRRATPVPAAVLIAGRTLTTVAVSLATTAVVIAVGWLVYGVHPAASTIPAVAFIATIGAAAFSALSYALSARIRTTDAAQPIVQALILPLYFVSGVFVPPTNLPEWLRRLGEIFPVERLADGLHHTYLPDVHGSGIAWTDLGLLTLWGIAGLTLAVRAFSWTPTSQPT